MTSIQEQLIKLVTTPSSGKYRADRASFNGPFMNCEADVKSGSKIKKQKWSFVFDSAEDCQGAKIIGRKSGAYVDAFARDTFEAICDFSETIAKIEM